MNTSRLFCLTFILTLLFASLAQARMVAVSSSLANIRETPKINQYNLFLQAPRYYPLRVIDKQGNFLKVQDFKGHIGWVNDSVVDSTRSVVVKVKRSNLRSGPGTKYKVVLHAERGVCFKVLRVKGSWIKLQHASGTRGWMHSSLLWGL
ncbi:MAG: peptide-binding protein [Desulfuromonas sp.]|nr:MAG: peptide-binding protein [Desulfuromonas sp.]